MASSDEEEWENAPEDDSEDEFVPEAPPAPAAIREAYAREQAQAPRAAPKGSDPDPDDETLDDLRAILTIILAPFPAGLVIYWTVNNILTMAQQLFIMKRTTVKTVT